MMVLLEHMSNLGIPSNVKLTKKAKDSLVRLLSEVIPDVEMIEFSYVDVGVFGSRLPLISFKTNIKINVPVLHDLQDIGLFTVPKRYQMVRGARTFVINPDVWLGR